MTSSVSRVAIVVCTRTTSLRGLSQERDALRRRPATPPSGAVARVLQTPRRERWSVVRSPPRLCLWWMRPGTVVPRQLLHPCHGNAAAVAERSATEVRCGATTLPTLAPGWASDHSRRRLSLLASDAPGVDVPWRVKRLFWHTCAQRN